jgi:Family of unknown function (DUF6173)
MPAESKIRGTMERLSLMAEPAAIAPLPTISIRSLAETVADGQNVAKRMCQVLADDIVAFEQKLNPSEEVGARIVGAPDGSAFHIEGMRWRTWEMIGFTGRTAEGRPVQVLQHVSQVNVMLVALPTQGHEGRRIGFLLRQQNEKS